MKDYKNVYYAEIQFRENLKEQESRRRQVYRQIAEMKRASKLKII